MAAHDSNSVIQFQKGVAVGRETKPKKCLHLSQFVRAGNNDTLSPGALAYEHGRSDLGGLWLRPSH